MRSRAAKEEAPALVPRLLARLQEGFCFLSFPHCFSHRKPQKLRKATLVGHVLGSRRCHCGILAAQKRLAPRSPHVKVPGPQICHVRAGADGYFKSCTELQKQNPQRQPARCELNIAHRVSPGDIDRGEGGEDGVGVAVGVLDFLFLKVNVVGRCPDVARQAGEKAVITAPHLPLVPTVPRHALVCRLRAGAACNRVNPERIKLHRGEGILSAASSE